MGWFGKLYVPDRFKQFAWLPNDVLLVSKDEDSEYYEDMRKYGALGYFALEDGHKETEDGDFLRNEMEMLTFGWVSEEMYGMNTDSADGWRLIPAFKCPQCGNKMTVYPFKKIQDIVYVCSMCGEERKPIYPEVSE